MAAISRPAFLDDADSFHAEAVREMVQSGDWVTLRIDNGIRYLEKAPFMYWLAALSVSAFGLHDWAIRLPTALFSLLLILLVFRFGVAILGRKGRLLLRADYSNMSRPLRFYPDIFAGCDFILLYRFLSLYVSAHCNRRR